MNDRRSFADAADYAGAIDSFEQRIQIGVFRRILPNDGVFDRYAKAFVRQARHDIQSSLLVGAKIVFLLEVEDERRIRRFRDLAQAGFKTFRDTRVHVSVAQISRLNVQLELGSASESIVVDDTVSPLNSGTVAQGAIIGEQKIVQLPLNGRQFIQLALLVPGASSGGRAVQQNAVRQGQVGGLNVSIPSGPARIAADAMPRKRPCSTTPAISWSAPESIKPSSEATGQNTKPSMNRASRWTFRLTNFWRCMRRWNDSRLRMPPVGNWA